MPLSFHIVGITGAYAAGSMFKKPLQQTNIHPILAHTLTVNSRYNHIITPTQLATGTYLSLLGMLYIM